MNPHWIVTNPDAIDLLPEPAPSDPHVALEAWGVDGPPGATGVLSGRGGRKRGPLTRSNYEVMHLMQGCHCALLQKLCKMPKSQTLNP